MTKFVLNQEVPFEEGLHCEFKSVRVANPIPLIRDFVDVYVVAYLNRGIVGSIYWGITDNRHAIGVSLDTGERDDVRKAIDAKLRSIIPAILPVSYDVKFHPLFSTSTDKDPIPDQPIIEVKVERVSPRQVYFTQRMEGKQAFIKTLSGREEVKADRLVELQREIQVEQTNQEEQEVNLPASEAPAVKASKAPSIPTPFKNPYNTAVIAKEDMFKGRETEINSLLYAITNGTPTAIFGLQRVGKTSLVKETLRRSTERCIFAEVNLQSYGGESMTSNALLHAIVTGIAAEISQKRLQLVSAEIAMLASDYRAGEKHRMLEDYERILKNILKATRRKVILFLDEFSELCQTVDRNELLLQHNPHREARIRPQEMLVDVSLMHWFSSLMKDPELDGKVVVIIAVRPFVAEYDTDERTGFQIMKLVSPITLHYLNKEAAEALMVEPVKGKVNYEAGSIDYLYNLTAGHPYLIQFFLREIINRIQQKGRSCIETQDITDLEAMLVSAEHVYDGQFAVLDSDYSVESVRNSKAAGKGRGVLSVIAYLGRKQKNGFWVPVEEVSKLLTSHDMPKNEIYDILAKLRRARIIEERGTDKAKLEYRISIPLLQKRYARQNMYERYFLQRSFRP